MEKAIEMDTEIEIVMEIETEIDIDVDTDNYVAAANVATATSPVRSRLAMDGTPRRRSTGAGSRGQHARRRWGHHAQQWRPTGFVKPTSTDESPTDVGEAAVAVAVHR